MQRKIKFRYWNDISKMMVHDPVVPTMKKEEWTLDQYFSDRGWVWQQFTGLKDKNGKDIYEGDILGGYPHATVWVEYASDWGCFEACWNEDYSSDVGYKAVKKESQLLANALLDCRDKWEIIGNIYENPELIKNYEAN